MIASMFFKNDQLIDQAKVNEPFDIDSIPEIELKDEDYDSEM
jgi:hypothetical protein